MNIILIGYMASGKSLIGRKLSDIFDMSFIDFDQFIETKENMLITDIFNKKGEIYFRKIESLYLSEVLNTNKNSIISLGGGTPCYGNNMEIIKNQLDSVSIYLQVSVSELTERLLSDKEQRPLIKHIETENDMNEYVGKHLFERMNFYNQADVQINGNQSPKDILEAIILKLF